MGSDLAVNTPAHTYTSGLSILYLNYPMMPCRARQLMDGRSGGDGAQPAGSLSRLGHTNFNIPVQSKQK